MSDIHLYTTFYYEKDEARSHELLTCIKNNINNPSIASVTVFNEGESIKHFSVKIKEQVISKRPTYTDFIEYINANINNEDIHIIANTDIFFDQNIALLKQVMSDEDCFALSRWDTTEGDKPLLYNHNDSQDAWIFKGPIKKNLKAHFPLGVPRCDNRFMYELQEAGYDVRNPAFSIKAYHLHKGQRAWIYTEADNRYCIPKPYRYLYPHNLYGLWGTWNFNINHKTKLEPYRYDIKKVNTWIPIRLIRKTLEILTGKTMPLIGYSK